MNNSHPIQDSQQRAEPPHSRTGDELREYDRANHAGEHAYSDPRSSRFDDDYIDPVAPRYRYTDADGFFNPMNDVIKSEVAPGSMGSVQEAQFPIDLSRALEENPEAYRHFSRLPSLRRQQIINSLGHDNQADRRKEHLNTIVRKLVVESRRDVELGKE